MLKSITVASKLCVMILASWSSRLCSTASSASSTALYSLNTAKMASKLSLLSFPVLLAVLWELLVSWVVLCCVPYPLSLPFLCFAGSHLGLLLCRNSSKVYFMPCSIWDHQLILAHLSSFLLCLSVIVFYIGSVHESFACLAMLWIC